MLDLGDLGFNLMTQLDFLVMNVRVATFVLMSVSTAWVGVYVDTYNGAKVLFLR